MDCAIRTDDAMVSRHHARMYWGGGGYVLEDLQSANGCYYQEQKVAQHMLKHGDAVRCGSLWLRYIDTSQLARDGLLVAATVLVTRIVWVFPFTYLPRRLSAKIRSREPYPPWRHTLLVAWTGMRGAVSLAAALALPLLVDDGGAFPQRDLIIFCAFSVILVTLLLQGLTLPPLIKWLGVDDYDEELEQEEVSARLAAVDAAMARLDELLGEEWVLDDTVDRVRGAYAYRQRRFTALSRDGEFDGGIDGDGIDYETRSVAYQRLVREVIEAQRSTVIDLRDSGEINDDVLRRIERELDLEDSRLEI